MAKFCNTYDLKKDIGFMAAVMSGAFLLGTIICFLVVKVFGADTTAQIASIFAIVGGVIFLMLSGTLGLKNSFELSVGMSQTRKNFIRKESVEAIIVTIALLLLGILLYKIDDFIQNTLYRGLPVELDVRFLFSDFLVNPMNFLTIVFAVLGLRFLFGALFMKFGQNFLWGCWAVWMFLCLGAQRVAHIYLKNLAGAAKFLSDASKLFGGYFWQIMIWIGAVVLFSIAYLMLARQEAKGY